MYPRLPVRCSTCTVPVQAAQESRDYPNLFRVPNESSVRSSANGHHVLMSVIACHREIERKDAPTGDPSAPLSVVPIHRNR
eukprot:559645-Prymnesium_polylepis.2